MLRRVIAFLIVFTMVFEQSGFAQVAGPIGVPVYLQNLVTIADRYRPVHLRAIGLEADSANVRIDLEYGDDNLADDTARDAAAKKLMEYFQIGLRLPNSSFWVNLRPDSPDRMIDPMLEKTDLGKVLLEADLQLKKDLCRLTDPDTKEGKKYWARLYEKAESLFPDQDAEIPTATRPWIVPGEIIVGHNGNGAYVYKAALKVMLEEDYVSHRNLVGCIEGQSTRLHFPAQEQDHRIRQLNSYSSQLIKELILPELTREINASRRYAALRQVYYSLILAQWAKKQRLADSVERLAKIDTGDLAGLTSKTAWSKDTYFQAYRDSFSRGEYNKQENVKTSRGITIRNYFSGGFAMPENASGVFISMKDAGEGVLFDLTQGMIVDAGDTEGAQTAFDGGNRQKKMPRYDAAEFTPLTGQEVNKIARLYVHLLFVARRKISMATVLRAGSAQIDILQELARLSDKYGADEVAAAHGRFRESFAQNAGGFSDREKAAFFDKSLTDIFDGAQDTASMRDGGEHGANRSKEITPEMIDLKVAKDLKPLYKQLLFAARRESNISSVYRQDGMRMLGVVLADVKEANRIKAILLKVGELAFKYGTAEVARAHAAFRDALISGNGDMSEAEIRVFNNEILLKTAGTWTLDLSSQDGGMSKRADLPELNAQITEWSGRYSIPDSLKARLADIAAWKQLPDDGRGRAGIVFLRGPVQVKVGNTKVKIKAVKIKGLGDFNDGAIAQPQPQMYERSFHFMPFADEQGHLTIESVDRTPVGGLGYARARNEYDKLHAVLASGRAIANIPLAYGQYPDISFEGDKLGFVVEGIVEQSDLRFENLLNDLTLKVDHGSRAQTIVLGSDIRARLKARTGQSIDPARMAASVFDWYNQWGKALRGINDAGILHLRTHSGNWGVGADNKVVVHDFDSAVNIRDIGQRQAFMLRLYSELGGAVRDIHHDSVRFALFQLTMMYGKNPYEAFLRGYFGDELYSNSGGLQTLSAELVKLADKKLTGENYPQYRAMVNDMAAACMLEPLAESLGQPAPYTNDGLVSELSRYRDEIIAFQERELGIKRKNRSALGRLADAIPGFGNRKDGGIRQSLDTLRSEDVFGKMNGFFGKDIDAANTIDPKLAGISFDGKENRLGWTPAMIEWIFAHPETVESVIADAEAIRVKKYEYVIFCGMGGSGLSVQAVRSMFARPDDDDMRIYSLRTTDPAAIKEILDEIAWYENDDIKQALKHTLIIPISKSGTTAETVTHKEYFEKLYADVFKDDPAVDIEDHMWVMTDKGSPFDKKVYPQRDIQLNGAGDVGGRFTAPTTRIFLMPLALVAPDMVWPVLRQARAMHSQADMSRNDFVRLGAFLYRMAAVEHKDKVTFLFPEKLRDLAVWAEQLVEESLGKDGKGITLFYGEDIRFHEELKPVGENDRVFVRFNLGEERSDEQFWKEITDEGYPSREIDIDDISEIGGVMLGLQLAVATVGYLWDIRYVDQPGVEGYKKATRAVQAAVQPGTKIGPPDAWHYASHGSLRLYYDTLYSSGIAPQEIRSEVGLMGATMDDAAAVFAAAVKILSGTAGFQAAEIASYGRMTPEVREVFEDARRRIFTQFLHIPAKLGEGPDKNHSYHQNIAQGKDQFLSIYYMPDVFPQPARVTYDDNLIRAQAVGTVQSLADGKRKVVLLTSAGPASASAGDLAAFFDHVKLYLGIRDRSAVQYAEFKRLRARMDDISADDPGTIGIIERMGLLGQPEAVKYLMEHPFVAGAEPRYQALRRVAAHAVVKIVRDTGNYLVLQSVLYNDPFMRFQPGSGVISGDEAKLKRYISYFPEFTDLLGIELGNGMSRLDRHDVSAPDALTQEWIVSILYALQTAKNDPALFGAADRDGGEIGPDGMFLQENIDRFYANDAAISYYLAYKFLHSDDFLSRDPFDKEEIARFRAASDVPAEDIGVFLTRILLLYKMLGLEHGIGPAQVSALSQSHDYFDKDGDRSPVQEFINIYFFKNNGLFFPRSNTFAHTLKNRLQLEMMEYSIELAKDPGMALDAFVEAGKADIARYAYEYLTSVREIVQGICPDLKSSRRYGLVTTPDMYEFIENAKAGSRGMVLIVEDDPVFAQRLAEFYIGAGFSINWVDTISKAKSRVVAELSGENPDGIVLVSTDRDLVGSSETGEDLAREVAGRIPTVVISGGYVAESSFDLDNGYSVMQLPKGNFEGSLARFIDEKLQSANDRRDGGKHEAIINDERFRAFQEEIAKNRETNLSYYEEEFGLDPQFIEWYYNEFLPLDPAIAKTEGVISSFEGRSTYLGNSLLNYLKERMKAAVHPIVLGNGLRLEVDDELFEWFSVQAANGGVLRDGGRVQGVLDYKNNLEAKRLIGELGSSMGYKRAVAARKLGETGNPLAIGPLIDILTSDEAEDIRAIAASGLQSFDDDRVTAVFNDALQWKAGNYRIRAIAMDYLERHGMLSESQKTGKYVNDLLDKNWPDARALGARMLRGVKEPYIVDLLKDAIGDWNSKVRSEAVESLETIGKMTDALYERRYAGDLESDSAEVIDAAVNALRKINTPWSLGLLQRTLLDGVSSVARAASAKGLGLANDPGSKTALEQALVDRSRYVRRQAEASLRDMGLLTDEMRLRKYQADLNDGCSKNILHARNQLKAMGLSESEIDALKDSYVKDGGVRKTGGIDLRVLPIAAQPMSAAGKALPGADVRQLQALAAQADLTDMDAAWRRIMRDVSKDSAGYENLRQFIAACRVRNDTGHLKAASDWLKRTLMLEEENAISTPQVMMELLYLAG